MDSTELQEAYERLAGAFQEFVNALWDAFYKAFGEIFKRLKELLNDFLEQWEKSNKPKRIPPVKKHKRDYLRNQRVSSYKVDRKLQKNLPYMRRNY